MASGIAKHTGRLGVCLGTTGPGAVHLLNGLYDAHLDGAPVLAGVGAPSIAEALRGRFVSVTRVGEDLRVEVAP